MLTRTLIAATAFALISPPAVASPNRRRVLWDADANGFGAPSTWQRGERATSHDIVTFHVPLRGANQGVEDLLAKVSDPTSKQYGEYLTVEELSARFGAPKDVQNRVKGFFERQRIECELVGGASLACRAKATAVEQAFETEMFHFKHKLSAKKVLRHIGTLSLPESIADGVEFVTGLGQFFNFRERQVRFYDAVQEPTVSDNGSGCPGKEGQNCFITPFTLRSLYNVSKDMEVGSAKTSVGVAEFSGNFAISDTDLALFGKKIGSEASPLAVDQRGGEPNDSSEPASTEAQLDIEYTSSMGNGVSNWVWNQEHWIYALCMSLQNATNSAKRPSVISMSYAWSEANQCGGVTGAECRQLGVDASAYVNRTNLELAKIGLLGITMLSASGDSGCHGRTEGLCLLQKTMKPAYPASSPYVTSVGGTILQDGQVATSDKEPVCQPNGNLAGVCASGGKEVVSSTNTGGRISSGGGFAAYSTMPEYQRSAVEKYLSNDAAMQFAGGRGTLFNIAGRGYPDIAALAHKYFVIIGNSTGSVDGTSAASPTVAGLVGLINSRRIAAGKPLVGFLNPMLYQIHNVTGGSAFNDITEGDNACTEQGCWCKTGFKAVPGWDASTGLGSPNLGLILEAMERFDLERETSAQTKH